MQRSASHYSSRHQSRIWNGVHFKHDEYRQGGRDLILAFEGSLVSPVHVTMTHVFVIVLSTNMSSIEIVSWHEVALSASCAYLYCIIA